MTPPRIKLKRAYEIPSDDDGSRILVERLWPRGVSKAAAAIDHWVKDLAPSHELRRWYGHVPERWPEFRRRYIAELEAADREALASLKSLCRAGPVTFVFAARDETRNGAVVLRQLILSQLG